ncbi:MAG: ImmA/IrrE family metallo-endopeptidase [Anaerolineales bacterium]|nr:ImmA/IrrE family metallo-endopeptidase [Anaerolineales bacterium]
MAADAIDQLDPRELGQNLKLAREQRGLRQEDAAKIIDVARTTITAIEQGKRRIQSDELIVLAKAYGRSASDFMRPRPVARDFRVQFRGPVSALDIENDKISLSEDEFQELCRNYLELEGIMNAPLSRNYPPQYRIEGLGANQAAESIAIQERNRLGLGDGPLPMMRSIFEQDVGLRVFFMQFEDSQFSEMYYYDEELGGCLAVNQNHPEERRRWSLAHGYAHFLVHRFQSAIYYVSGYQREQFADFFAKYFLMPTSGLTRQYHSLLQAKAKPTIGDLCVLANYYAVSLSALVRRLEDLGVAPSGTWERLRERGIKVREAQQQLGLAPIPEQSQLLPLRYQYLAVEAFEQEAISEGLLAKFLRVDRLEARRIIQVLSAHTSDIDQEELIDFNIEELV